MAIQYISTGTECLVLATDIEIESKRLRRIHAVVSSKTTKTATVAVGKSKLVYIVEIAQKCYLISVPEAIYIKIACIAAIGARSGIGHAKPAIFHTWLHGKIYYSFLLAVVDTSKAREIALAVYNLERNNTFDCSKAKNELGFTPRPYAETLHDTAAWLKATGKIH